MPRPRPLSFHDVSAAMELCEEARWNQTADDWRMLIERDQEACFGLYMEGELAATTTLVCYGKGLGWIGMVLTRERFRRRGCASLLVKHAIELAAARGIETLKMDATDMGAPIYASLGFAGEQPVERWLGEIPPCLETGKDGEAGAISGQLDLE
ncbi:MAG: GNAT family N-acetyltransferase, partial [Acidobacteriota bacterium]|nr:GNAT family N-acetyltransferase [Acidobacteriota bacterium]